MIKDLSKVIRLPKNVPLQEMVTYICTCDRCQARQLKNASIINQKNELAKHVENMLLMTPLATKNIQLLLSSQSNEYGVMTNEQLIHNIEEELSDHKQVASSVKRLARFVIHFNRKYRHPLICILHDHTINLMEEVSHIPDIDDFPSQLRKHNTILHHILLQKNVINLIKKEDFIADKELQLLQDKLLRAKKQTAASAKKLIRDYYRKQLELDLQDSFNITQATTHP